MPAQTLEQLLEAQGIDPEQSTSALNDANLIESGAKAAVDGNFSTQAAQKMQTYLRAQIEHNCPNLPNDQSGPLEQTYNKLFLSSLVERAMMATHLHTMGQNILLLRQYLLGTQSQNDLITTCLQDEMARQHPIANELIASTLSLLDEAPEYFANPTQTKYVMDIMEGQLNTQYRMPSNAKPAQIEQIYPLRIEQFDLAHQKYACLLLHDMRLDLGFYSAVYAQPHAQHIGLPTPAQISTSLQARIDQLQASKKASTWLCPLLNDIKKPAQSAKANLTCH